MIGIKYAWKDWKIICMKIQYSLHQCKDSLDQIFNPNHSHTYTHANPSAHNLEAAQKHPKQVCIFWLKFQNWNRGSKAFQGKIPIAIACKSFTEPNCIVFQPLHAQNCYTKLELFPILCIFVFQFSSIPIAFFLWIHTNWFMLKLTIQFDWIFMRHTRFHDWC